MAQRYIPSDSWERGIGRRHVLGHLPYQALTWHIQANWNADQDTCQESLGGRLKNTVRAALSFQAEGLWGTRTRVGKGEGARGGGPNEVTTHSQILALRWCAETGDFGHSDREVGRAGIAKQGGKTGHRMGKNCSSRRSERHARKRTSDNSEK